MKSPRAAGQGPKPGTKARYPGWAYRAVSGRMSVVSRAKISSKATPCSGGGSPRRRSVSSRLALRNTGSLSGSSSRSISISTTWYAIRRIVSDSIANGLPVASAMRHKIPPTPTLPRKGGGQISEPRCGKASVSGRALGGFLQLEPGQTQAGVGDVTLCQQPFNSRGRQRPGEVVALTGDAPDGPQCA